MRLPPPQAFRPPGPRIAKPHDLGPLVERFAGGIIHCRAVTLVLSRAVDGKKLCVAARDKKKKGKATGATSRGLSACPSR